MTKDRDRAFIEVFSSAKMRKLSCAFGSFGSFGSFQAGAGRIKLCSGICKASASFVQVFGMAFSLVSRNAFVAAVL